MGEHGCRDLSADVVFSIKPLVRRVNLILVLSSFVDGVAGCEREPCADIDVFASSTHTSAFVCHCNVIQPTTNLTQHDPSTSCGIATSSNPFCVRSCLTTSSDTCAQNYHIVTGTFNSRSLFVLTYDVLNSKLSILHSIRAEGPHQYLALGVSSRQQQTVYATTWGTPSALSAWHVSPTDYSLSFGNRREITATGSYVHVQPPPYLTRSAPGFGSLPGVARWLGSAGGPTGELHTLDPETGRIETRVKEMIFLAGGEKQLATADKTRKALRYGAHSFDCSASSSSGQGQVAYVADLGANAIQAYRFASLDHLYTIVSKREEDGPRHVIPHPEWPLVFTVTEHSNYVDAYQVPPYDSDIKEGARHVAEADLLTPQQAASGRSNWRGDTLRFSSDLRYIYATTRGKTMSNKGLLVALRLTITPSSSGIHVDLREVARFHTRTSGGKANAIELAPTRIMDGLDHMVLTDDEQGWIDVVAFDLNEPSFHVKASTQLPPIQHHHQPQPQGASHAIWLL